MAEASIRPSRDFLVRQATLTALSKIYVTTFPRMGAGYCARQAADHLRVSSCFAEIIVADVQREYRTLASIYRVAA